VPQSSHHIWYIGLYALSLCVKSVSCHLIQEPYLLRGHYARSFPSFLYPSLSSFTYFPTFVSSTYKRDLAKRKRKRKEKETLYQPSLPVPTICLSHICVFISTYLSPLNPLSLSYSTTLYLIYPSSLLTYLQL
jgi:hypothetical protein